MMDTVPKLFPSWHDVTFQDFIRQKKYFNFSYLNPTDYGGIGLDVNVGDEITSRTPKHVKSLVRFAADKCALPFFPLKRIKHVNEPCLQDLRKKKFDFNKFCHKFTHARRIAAKKNVSSNLKSLKQDIDFNIHPNNAEVDLHIPTNLVQLAESMPKRPVFPSFNVDYVGGILAVCSSSNKQNLLHPDRKNMAKLCITPLLAGNDQYYLPDISETSVVNLKKDPILQIEPAIDGFCCVRQKNYFHLVNTRDSTFHSKTVHNSLLYHIVSSPYNPLEVLSIYDKGVMKLINMDTRQTLWSLSEDIYDPFVFFPTWRCSFGSHPFSAFGLNEKNLYSVDFREKKILAREIYSIVNSSCYVDEELVGIKQWNKNPFQHLLASNKHLIICDERYPKTSIMHWNHCLSDSPVYIECADYMSDMSIIVIGTQGSQQLATFLCSYQGDIQPTSLSSPFLLSSPTDCINSLKLHCHYIDDKITTRLSSPLIGMCIIPNTEKRGFTVLQSTSLGDIFYQDFKESFEASERTYRVSIGCVLTPPEKILPHLKELISDEKEETSEVVNADAQLKINIDKVLSPPKQISVNCTLCRTSTTADDKELVQCDPCPMCNLNAAESEHFSNASINNFLVIGPTSSESGFLDCDVENLSKFDDKYSKKMLSVWLQTDDVEENY